MDFLQVINERKRYYVETENYQMLADDIRNNDRLTTIKKRKNAIIMMEGVSMYLSVDEMQDLTNRLCAHFENIMLLVDSFTTFAAKMSKRNNPINDVEVSEVFGIDHPKAYESE